MNFEKGISPVRATSEVPKVHGVRQNDDEAFSKALAGAMERQQQQDEQPEKEADKPEEALDPKELGAVAVRNTEFGRKLDIKA